jgi:Coatomer epsilon subunit
MGRRCSVCTACKVNLTQIETWVALFSAGDFIQQAYYVYEELIATYGVELIDFRYCRCNAQPNHKLLTGQAITQIHRGFIPEADSLLTESFSQVSSV